MKKITIKKTYRDWLNLVLPYLTTLIGVLLSFLVFHNLINRSLIPLIGKLEETLPWVVLILGVLLAILLGLAVRLIQLARFRGQSYEIVNKDFKKEIIERIRAEKTKQKLEKALLQGQKLQAIGTLASGIAHDFNNILYAITGYVEMVREDLQTESLAYKNLGKVIEASKRGQELVGRILAFSRRGHHEFNTICLQNTIEGALSLLKPAIPASVTINYKNKLNKKCFILGNQTQLHQILVNIINNAVDAMEGEGTVDISLTIISPKDELLQQFPKIKNVNYCQIDIADTGYGMDQTILGRMFEPFFTTKEVGKGTGLGLATVHSIMKEHHGEILVESKLGHGTIFTLLLPEHIERKEKPSGENIIS